MLKIFKNYPTKKQWKVFFTAPQKVLSVKEIILFLFFLVLFLINSVYLTINFYIKNTNVIPKKGGVYTEGMIGQPRFINPVYSSYSDIDRDLTELIFSGLMKYNKEGKIVPDLIKNYEIKENGKVYEIELKDNLLWSDGEPLTVEDVIFTIKILQDPSYKSPQIANWLGVEVEKISEKQARFILKNPYGPFLENLTQKIIPKHIWNEVLPENFPLSLKNLKPIGSGPYKLDSLQQDKNGKIISLTLTTNNNYHGKTPYLSKINFNFYNSEQEIISALKRKEIDGAPVGINIANEVVKKVSNLNLYSAKMPRYFAVFLNQNKSKILAEKSVREALNYGTNKQELVEKILGNKATQVNSPLLPDIYGFNSAESIYNFNPEKANNLLDEAGFVLDETSTERKKTTKKSSSFKFTSELREGNKGKEVEELQKCLSKDSEIYPEGIVSGYFGEQTKTAVIKFQEKYKEEILAPSGITKGTGIVGKSTRDKLNKLCFPPLEETLSMKFSLITVDQPLLIQVAKKLAGQWRNIGVNIEIVPVEISQLEKEFIKPRNYEMLLFGNVLTMIPDPLSFWHSDQVKDPGLNLAIYQSKEADQLLKEARQTNDENMRKEKLEKFQSLLIKDAPTIFLYNPDYLYFVSKKVKGIEIKNIVDPSKRFTEIEDWYIKEKRVWK